MDEQMILDEDSVDDCWNRIGTRGDNTCPELQTHVRCLNCPTFAGAASLLLDRVEQNRELAGEWVESAEQAARRAEEEARALQTGARHGAALVFRVAGEWQAIATSAVIEVAEARAVHSLPHQRNRAVLGVQNIRGALRICVSLGLLFQLPEGAGEAGARKQMVVVEHLGQTLVFPVDEVAGVHRFDVQALEPVPTTLAHAATQYTRGLLDWRGHKIGLLDHDLLFYALNRSMT